MEIPDEKIEEIFERQVKPYGNSFHISIPSRHKEKTAKIIILKDQHLCQRCGKPVYNKYDPICSECKKQEKKKTLSTMTRMKNSSI